MVRSSNVGKKSVNYRQFQGGYARVPSSTLRAVLEGYRLGQLRRAEVRVFAAQCEAAALHKDSRVSLYRIVNCQSQQKGNRRMSHAEIETAAATLGKVLPKCEAQLSGSSEDSQKPATTKPVARRVLRHIARGGATTVEALFYFAYFMRRIPQRKPMQRLRPNEHYARFRYRDFEAWTGVHRATQSRLFKRMPSRGFLNTVPVAKQNENAFGQLFIDGPMLSLVRRRQSHRGLTTPGSNSSANRQQERSTPPGDLVNTRRSKTSTLRNRNPRTEIQRRESSNLELRDCYLARHGDPNLRRIALRASQMQEQLLQQAA